MTKNPKTTTALLEIPLVQSSESEWTGKLTLTAWSGYNFDPGNTTLAISERVSEGASEGTSEGSHGAVVSAIAPIVDVTILMGEATLNQSGKQAAALQYLLTHQAEIRDNMLPAIWKMVIDCYQDIYNDILAPGGDHSATWAKVDEIANNPSADDLKSLKPMMGIRTLELHPESAAGPVQLSLTFECAWDIEHGLEVLIEQGKIVEVNTIGDIRPRDY